MTLETQSSTASANFKGRKALVIDDDRDIATLLGDFLIHLGFDVKQCYDGMQARQWVSTTAFDLIFVDLKIPSLNGLQVAAIARTTKENKHANIYVISGILNDQTKSMAQGLKIRHFIDKPVDLNELTEKIQADFIRQEKKVVYDVRIINSFVEAAGEIFEFYFQEPPQRGKIMVRQPGQPEKGYCTGLIALMGNGFVGTMGVSLNAPFIKKLAETLFQGMDVKYDNDFITDLTGEMCNQILGKVKFNFAKLGITIKIGLPEVIIGKNHVIQYKTTTPVVCVPIGKGNEVFELQFVLSQQDVNIEESKQSDIPVSNVMLFE